MICCQIRAPWRAFDGDNGCITIVTDDDFHFTFFFFLTKGCENVTTLDANEVRQLEVYILIFHKKKEEKKDVCIFVYLIRGLRFFGDNKK